MIRSMTGFGEAELEIEAGRLRLEVKTVNHRFLNANIKTPNGFDRFEKAMTDALKLWVSRGHVSAYLTLDRSSVTGHVEPSIDLEKAKGYQTALETLKRELDVPGDPDLEMLTRFSDIFRAPERNQAISVEEDDLLRLVRKAGSGLRAMREAEGLRLASDLDDRLRAIESRLDEVEKRAPERLTEQRTKLRRAVQELSAQVEVDEDRLAREIAYLAEKWDINEEIVRFRSHIDLFRTALNGDASEPVGKRLGFLVQEMLREANTVASKANDSKLAQASVAIKEEIERIREQVENVE
ncbi:MAG: YicC family protein [Gemmatimonadetes bacterium]|mgnify:FL=1|nr:YicC family protein [Gemmatimonadota bacterium]